MLSIGHWGWRGLFAVALLCPNPACAHDFWIEPSTFQPLPGMTISVALRVGQDFIGDPVPYMSNAIDAFFVRQDGEDETLSGSEGLEPAAFLRASGNATAIVAYSSAGSTVELPAGRFKAYLEQYGLDETISERRLREEDAKPARECFYRYAKALLSGTAPSPSVTQLLPFAYEIVPDRDPTTGFGVFRGHIFYDGEPLADARVEALHRQDPSVRLSVRSDAQGGFSLTLPQAGVWLVKSVHMVRAGFFSDCDWESSWASLTFEMPEERP
ncbi:DUF4198 domain-containing protein [Mesorhizobium onobrychidis]|uniref:DUF4198 domain-containing protein n=1 Tax=Mesorhizobium onobrychidis TaxID=2775404 RepID=A0ABY5R7G2_9HYPH|nr:DUF4198 domain-containing protein [Mesorhizobium onobrychidis]UVC19431.1 DUF4198 domain-containing protein [Mesorhizobium onobrychidis]